MKRFFLVFAVILVVVLAALFILPVLFKDRLVGIATEQANQNMNATVSLGDFHLTLFRHFPDFTLVVEEMELRNKAPFEGKTLTRVGEFAFTLDVLSVLRGEQIRIKEVSLIDPEVYVYVKPDGTASYDIALPDDAAGDEPETEGTTGDFSFALQAYTIENATVHYVDSSMGLSLELAQLNHSGTGDFTLSEFLLSTRTTVESLSLNYEGVRYMNQLALQLEADLGVNLDNMSFAIKNNRLLMNELELRLEGQINMPSDDILMDLTFAAHQPELKKLLSLIPAVYMTGFESLYANGELKLEGAVSGTYNDSLYPAFQTQIRLDNGSVKYPDLPASISNIQVQARVQSAGGKDLDNTVIDVSNFHVDIANNPVDASIRVSTPVSDPDIDAKVYAKMNFAEVAKAIPMPGYQLAGMLDANLRMKGSMSALEMEEYERFEASGTFLLKDFNAAGDSIPYPVSVPDASLAFSPRFVTLERLSLSMPGIAANASGELENYLAYALKDDVLKGNMRLNASRVDLNELMGVEPEEAEGDDDSAMEQDQEEPVDASIPANLDLALESEINKLVYGNMVMTDFVGKLTVKNSRLDIQNAELKVFEGVVGMTGYYSTPAGNNPEYGFTLGVKRMDVGQAARGLNTVRKLAPVVEAANGLFNSQLEISGKLDDQLNPLLNTISGAGEVQTLDIAIENFKPFQRLGDKLKIDALKSQRFRDTRIPFEIVDGKVFVKPFTAALGPVKAKIAGSNSLDESIDYTMNLEIPRSKLPAEANRLISGLVDKANAGGTNFSVDETVDLDVFITRTLKDPKISTKLQQQGKNAVDEAKKKLQEEFDRKKAEAEQKAREELERKKKEAEEEARKAAEEAKEEARKKMEEEKEKAKDKAKDKIKDLFGNPK